MFARFSANLDPRTGKQTFYSNSAINSTVRIEKWCAIPQLIFYFWTNLNLFKTTLQPLCQHFPIKLGT